MPCSITTGASVPRFAAFTLENSEEALSTIELTVYPNPASVKEQIAIELKGITAPNEKINLIIYNMTGEKIYHAEIISEEEATLTIKPELQLAPGIYMAETQISGNVYKVKFVVK